MVTVTVKSDFSAYPEKFAKDCRRTNVPLSNWMLSVYFTGYTDKTQRTIYNSEIIDMVILWQYR